MKNYVKNIRNTAVICIAVLKMLKRLSPRLIAATDDKKTGAFFAKRISIAI